MRTRARFALFLGSLVLSHGPASQGAIADSASLSGMVVADSAGRERLSGVRVELVDRTKGHTRIALTGSDGRFRFDQLPEGSYQVSASKPAYLTERYGATAPNRPGLPIMVREGESITDLQVRLHRGGVITGVIRRSDGRPFASRRVALLQFKPGPMGPVWKRVPVDSASPDGRDELSDDRGVYRFYGLAPGEYRVAVGLTAAQTFSLHATTASDVARARRLLAEPPPASADSSASGPPLLGDLLLPTPASNETVSFAPIYFPGTPSLSEAATITLGLGEERRDVDIPVTWVRSGTIEGTIDGLEGPEHTVVAQALSREPTADGQRWSLPLQQGSRFTLAGLPPGSYTVEAAAGISGSRPGAAATRLWAAADVTVNDGARSDVALTLRRGATLRGRVMLAGGATPVSAKLTLTPEAAPGSFATRRVIEAGAVFELADIPPGRYRLSADTAGLSARGVSLRQIQAGGRDLQSEPLTLNAEDVLDVEVSLVPGLSRLSGAAQDGDGKPVTGLVILAFSPRSEHWFWESPFIRTQRLSTSSRFDITGLPPGPYLLAAVSDLELGQEFDPALLKDLAASAASVEVVAGRETVQDLRIGLGPTTVSAARTAARSRQCPTDRRRSLQPK